MGENIQEKRKRGKSRSDYPCGECDKECKRNTNCVQCADCKIWYHLECTQLTASLLNQLEKVPGLFWRYQSCRTAPNNLKTQVAEINQTVLDLKSGFNEISAITKQLETIKNLKAIANS